MNRDESPEVGAPQWGHGQHDPFCLWASPSTTLPRVCICDRLWAARHDDGSDR